MGFVNSRWVWEIPYGFGEFHMGFTGALAVAAGLYLLAQSVFCASRLSGAARMRGQDDPPSPGDYIRRNSLSPSKGIRRLKGIPRLEPSVANGFKWVWGWRRAVAAAGVISYITE